MAEFPLKAYVGSQPELNAIPASAGNMKINKDTGETSFELNSTGGKVELSAPAGATAWGSITGTLSAQTDLQTVITDLATQIEAVADQIGDIATLLSTI